MAGWIKINRAITEHWLWQDAERLKWWFDLLEYRYNAQLFTIITTNLTPKEIRQKYGNRIADRFNEMFDKVIFANETYRK